MLQHQKTRSTRKSARTQILRIAFGQAYGQASGKPCFAGHSREKPENPSGSQLDQVTLLLPLAAWPQEKEFRIREWLANWRNA